MARKYDRYGFNRQFKAKPCTKRYPFPYPLPFVDDFSAKNVLEKAVAAPGTVDPDTAFGGGRKRRRTRSEIEEDHARRRASNAKRKLSFPHPLVSRVYNGSYADVYMGCAAAPFVWAGPMIGEVVEDISLLRYGSKVASKSKPKFIRGKVPDMIRTGVRRAKKIWYIAKSNKPGPRFIRFMGKQVMKKTKLH